MRNFLMRTVYPYYAPDDETGAGGGDPQQQQSQDNKQNKDDNFEDLWQDSESGENKQTQQTNGHDQQPQQTQQETFDNFINSLNFMDQVEIDKISDDLSSGNTDSLQSAMSSLAKNVYKRALVDTDKLIQERVARAVDQAVQKSRIATEGDRAVQMMEQKLEFTKDPSINPIARAVLARLMSKGKNLDEAILGTRKFFENTAKNAGKALGISQPPRNSPRGRFDSPAVLPPSDGGDDGGIDEDGIVNDWEKFLT